MPFRSSKSRAMGSAFVVFGKPSRRFQSLEQPRDPEGERRIVQPERLRLRCRNDGSASRRLEVIRLRVSELVHAVREVGPNGPTTARHVSDAAAPRECKAGAELEPARIRLRSQIRDEPKAARDLRNDVVPALRAGETQ